MPFLIRFALPAFVFAGVFAVGCDQAPGPTADLGEPPVLSEFSFSPQTVAVPQGAEASELTIPLQLSVTASDPDGDIDRVAFVVQPPGSSSEPVADGQMSALAGSRYEASASITIPVGDVGVYTVLVYAVDRSGSLSNEVLGNLRVQGVGEPPVIEQVIAPDTLRRPQPGEEDELLTFIAVVTDPDGLSNVNRVEFWNVERPSSRFALFDTGEDGDEVEADGRYTRVVGISSSNQPGSNTFAFQATDLSGLTSAVVERTVVVE